MARPKSGDNQTLTDTEVLIMNILWDLQDGTVHQVLEQLNSKQSKTYAYTTISTLLRVLEKKQVVHSQKEGRGHRYFPSFAKSQYQQKATQHLVNQVFEGQTTALIRNLLGNASLTSKELAEVQTLLQQKSEK